MGSSGRRSNREGELVDSNKDSRRAFRASRFGIDIVRP